MKFPTPEQAYDDNGIASRLNSAIRKAGGALHDICENPGGQSSTELLARAGTIATGLSEEYVKTTQFIMGAVPRSTCCMSVSALAALMDTSGFVAEILNVVAELREEPADTLDVLHDLAFEMTTHDHAKSAANWIEAIA